jgi:hypothetical protein
MALSFYLGFVQIDGIWIYGFIITHVLCQFILLMIRL